MNQAVNTADSLLNDISSQAYSRYWRRDRSGNEVIELALALKALRKVANHIGRNVKPVFWAGMSAPNGNSILVNPDDINGLYPISYQTIDVYVGKVVREAFCSLEWTELVQKQVLRRIPAETRDKSSILIGIINTAEDIYIDEYIKTIIRSKVWHLYLAKYWQMLNHKETRDLTLPPTLSSLSNVWRIIILFNACFRNLHQYYESLLPVLISYSSKIKEVVDSPTKTERRNKRVGLYLEMWEIIYQLLDEWEVFDIDDNAVKMKDESGPKTNTENIEDNRDNENPDDDEPADSSLDEELASDVMQMLEEGDSDITVDIAVAIEDPAAAEMPTTISRATALSGVQADPRQVKRLRSIFKKQHALHKKLGKKKNKKFLEEGKLDARRLYRTEIDGKAFKIKIKKTLDKPWNIIILADVSASMSGRGSRKRPWDFAEKTFVSLVEAARGFKNNLDVYAYHEEKEECVLLKLYHSGKIHTVAPFGKTPSGQAIMAAALIFKDKKQNNLIIHITDGASNCGLNVTVPVKYCKKHNIDLITIGFNCSRQTQDFLRSRFPEGQLLLIDDIYALPDHLEQLFRRNLLRV